MPPPKLPDGLINIHEGLYAVERAPTRQTVWNWATRGVQRDPASKDRGRLFLKTVKKGRSLLTTRAWIADFVNQYNEITGRGNRL
jgi:hypothetical protein